MINEAMIPVTVNTTIIHNKILPSRFMLPMLATDEAIEKKTRGTTIVKSRLRNRSPKGLKMTDFSLKIKPKIQPHDMATSSVREKP